MYDEYIISWMSDSISRQLVKKHRLISDQITPDRLILVLSELEEQLKNGVGGNIVEFGCYCGTSSLFIRRLLDSYRQSESRQFHVYDSFEGLPDKTDEDNSPSGEQFKAGELSVSKKKYINNFAKNGLALPVIHKSWFSELGPKDVPENIVFAFIDGDFYSSTKDALKLIYPKLADGAVIVSDDFGRSELPGVEKAINQFASQNQIKNVRSQDRLAIIKL